MATLRNYGPRTLALAGTCCLMALLVPLSTALADPAPAQFAQSGVAGGSSGQSIQPNVSANAPEEIVVKAKRLLLKEKDSPSAVTELGAAQIAQTGVGGSVATLLRQAPSVYVYQQSIGNNEPVLTIRGLRGLEVATTLDGVPMQDLLNGGAGQYLQNNIGGRFNLDQISGVSLYPGVAYPDKNTFGTIGGTVAYDSLRPSNDAHADVFGSVGSFGTYNEGFEADSGRLNGPLGTGDEAPKFVIKYSNLQTNGFIQDTQARYGNTYFAADKPYDGGLSDFQATIIYNTGDGLIQSEPTPLPYLNAHGLYSNYPQSEVFQRQNNDYLTVVLKDDTYISDSIQAGLTAFYLHSDSTLESFGNINLYNPATNAPYDVGGTSPFVQTPAGFGYPDSYFSPGGSGGVYGGLFYLPGVYSYDPTQYANTAACPAAVVSAAGGVQNSPCGLNASLQVIHNDSYGIQPHTTIILPEMYGIDNTIKIGGLLAKETEPTPIDYLGATQNIPQDAAHLQGINGGGGFGGTERTIIQGYLQDKIDLLGNTLHFTPGLTLEGTYSSLINPYEFVSNSPLFPSVGTNMPPAYEAFKSTKWDRDYLPFFNASYDFDKILPALAGTSVYASYGSSALFAPTTDFTANTTGTAPYASIVHMYEAGAKYDTSKLLLSADYFYQKVDRDFGFFQGQAGPIQGQDVYTNYGQREFKGVEAAAVYQLTPGIQLFGNASHLLAKYLQSYLASTTVFEDQFGLAQKGTPIAGIPDWLANFGVDYKRNTLAVEGDQLNVRLSGQYTGHQYTTYDISGLEGNVGNNIAGVPANFYSSTGQPLYPTGYIPYLYKAGATTYDPHGGISPFAIFNVDLTYILPTPALPRVKQVKFDLNLDNIFNTHYFQYFYRQVSPANCGTFTSGPFKGLPESNYSCGGQFADGLSGEPFAVTFTATVRF